MADAYQCEEEPHIKQLRNEIKAEQVTRPIGDYTPERVERLVEQMSLAQRWTSPAEFVVNL